MLRQNRRDLAARPARARYPIPLSFAARMERGLEFIDEFLQLVRADVTDGKELETLCTPASDVKSLHRLEPRPLSFGDSSLRDEEIDHMRAAPIDNRRDRLPANIVEPPAEQRKSLPVRSTTGPQVRYQAYR